MSINRSLVMSIIFGIAVFFGIVVLAGCDSGPQATPVRAEHGHASLYVALGGDDVYGGARGLENAWPQVLFRTSLPITTTFVNLSGRREGVAEVLRGQVEAARQLRPDLVTITVADDAERGTAPAEVGADLDAIIRRLRSGTTTRVLVGTVPPDAAAPDVGAGDGSDGPRAPDRRRIRGDALSEPAPWSLFARSAPSHRILPGPGASTQVRERRWSP
jgi:hypothetical protein